MALVPVAALPLIIAVYVVNGSEVIIDNALLMRASNVVFLTLIPFVVAGLAAKVHLAAGSSGVLCIGTGLLAFGTACLLTAVGFWLRLDANFTVTVHNVAYLLLAFTCMATMILPHHHQFAPTGGGSRRTLILAYAGAVTAIGLIAAAVHAGLTPTFFVQGEGPTPIRQILLLGGLVLFASAATLAWVAFLRTKAAFVYWFTLALILMGTGAFGILFQSNIGSGLNWAGRIAQYLGCLYLLTAVLNARREAHKYGLSLQEAVHRFLGPSEAGYRLLVENSPDIVARFDRDLRWTYVNPAVKQLTGRSPEFFLGRSVHEIELDASNTRIMESAIRRALEEGGLQTAEIDYLTGEGRRTYHCRYMPELDGAGRVTSVLGLARDITDLKKAEGLIRESEQRFRATFELAAVGIAHMDEAGRFLRINERFCEITGYSREEMLRLSFQEITHPEDLALDNEQKVKLVTGELQTYALEKRYLRKGGEVVWVSLTVSAVRNQGDFAYAISVAQDISVRKRMEQDLRDLATTLETRVQERTVELERANRAKNVFLANMSHEIRTPMSGVLGMIDLILRRGLPSPVRGELELARGAAGTALALLNDLLDLSRIEQGKLGLFAKPFVVREMLAALIKPFELQAAGKEISFLLCVDPGVPATVLCDPVRLGQVLKNLLHNGLKFTQAGEIRLEVRSERLAGGTNRLIFRVTDTGIGIPPEKGEEIFLSFTQLDPTYSKKFAGAGLGLAISKKLVELMGGEITVESEVGSGASFCFTILYEEAPEGHAQLGRQMTLSDLPSLRILLAEDNPVNRLFLKRALTDAGHGVTEAENGRSALEKLEQGRFDLVLMDIQMPEVDGLEAARIIRSLDDDRAGVPIIALTAYAMKGDRERFLESGMNGYVAKPVDFAELAGEISAVLQPKPMLEAPCFEEGESA